MSLLKSRFGVLAVAACAAVTFSVAGCSSSGNSGGSAGTDAAASAGSGGSAAAGSPVKIGVVCTCSGAGLTEPGMEKAFKAWVGATNAAGGINGHPIKEVFQDDQGVPGKSKTAVQTLINDGVVAIVDMTSLDETWASLVQSKNIPVVGANTSTTPMFTNSDFYPEGQTEDALFPSIILAAKHAGATNLGLIYCAEAPQCQEGIKPLKDTGKALGLPVTYAGEVAATAPNYTAQCLAAKQKGVEALFIADVQFVALKVAANCDKQGYHPMYVVDGEILNDAFKTAPGIKDNLVSPSPNLPYFADAPAISTMNAALDKYAPGLRNDTQNWSEIAAEGYMSGVLFAKAAAAGGLGANGSVPSAAQVVKGLSALKGDTLDGLASPLSFAPGKPHVVHCWFETHLKNGTYSVPNGTKPTCEST